MSLLKRLENGSAVPGLPTRQLGTEPAAAPAKQSAPLAPQATEAQRSLKDRGQRKLISELDPSIDTTQIEEVRFRLKSLFDQIIEAENLVLTRAEKERLFEELAADVIGFGPIEPLRSETSVSEVMVHG